MLYNVILHRQSGKCEATTATIKPYDVADAKEQYEAHHGDCPDAPPMESPEFVAWWNSYSETTTCTHGVSPKIELVGKD